MEQFRNIVAGFFIIGSIAYFNFVIPFTLNQPNLLQSSTVGFMTGVIYGIVIYSLIKFLSWIENLGMNF